jgi:hypothetical protein
MLRTVEALIDENGKVQLLESIELSSVRRALVTILDEELSDAPHEITILSETALAEDWNRPEEDEAWAYLQSAPL